METQQTPPETTSHSDTQTPLYAADPRMELLRSHLSRELHRRFAKLYRRLPDANARLAYAELTQLLASFAFRELCELELACGGQTPGPFQIFFTTLNSMLEGARQIVETGGGV